MKYKKVYNDSIYFMDKNEIRNFFFKDIDNFVKKLSVIDLYARKVNSYEEYLHEISLLPLNFSLQEISKLCECSKEADDFFNSVFVPHTHYYKHINFVDIANIKWVFALIDTGFEIKYEDNMPHTRKNIIFLPKLVLNYSKQKLIELLIHEKIHIYQRYNSQLFDKVISDMGYRIVDKCKLNNIKLLRANPDINNNIYYNKKSKNILMYRYNSTSPSSINDNKIISLYEHPYEHIAYEISELYCKKMKK